MNVLSVSCAMLLLAGGAAAALAAGGPRPAPIVKMTDGGRKVIEVYAHRGARSFAPENTLPAYRTGLGIGTNWVDCDIGVSHDGQVVITHDPWLNPDIVRLANGAFLGTSKNAFVNLVPPARLDAFLQPYLVKNLDLAVLKHLDVGRLNPDSPYARFFPDQRPVDGTRMPTLEELIHYVKAVAGLRIGFQIEIKTDCGHPGWTASPRTFAEKLYAIMKKENIIDDTEVQAFDWRCLAELQKLDPRVRTAYLTEAVNETTDPASPDFPSSFFNPDPALAGLWTGGALAKDYGCSIPRMVKALGGTNWEPEDVELTRTALDEAHRLGLKVCTWTWPEHTGQAFNAQRVEQEIDWGVDGIITDDPGRLISILAARGYKLPRRYLAPE